VIVLGGGMSNIGRLYETLPLVIERQVFSDAFETPVVRAVHGDSSGVRGAAWLWPPESDSA
jgi:fructokinase